MKTIKNVSLMLFYIKNRFDFKEDESVLMRFINFFVFSAGIVWATVVEPLGKTMVVFVHGIADYR